MTTLKQLQANRLNSQKSTGPRTPAGQAVSRMNALKSGIDAQSNIITGEDPAALDSLTRQYYERLQPQGPEECALIDTVVYADWLLRRLRKTEAQMWDRRIDRNRAWFQEHGVSLDHLQEAAYADRDREKDFDRLHRRIAAFERSLRTSLESLARLRKQGFGLSLPSDEPEPDLPEPNAGTNPFSSEFEGSEGVTREPVCVGDAEATPGRVLPSPAAPFTQLNPDPHPIVPIISTEKIVPEGWPYR